MIVRRALWRSRFKLAYNSGGCCIVFVMRRMTEFVLWRWILFWILFWIRGWILFWALFWIRGWILFWILFWIRGWIRVGALFWPSTAAIIAQ